MLIEPVQGESGVNLMETEFLAPRARPATRVGARSSSTRSSAGWAAPGTLWAYEQTGVVPDAMTLAKGLGGGLPIGALVIGERCRTSSRPATTVPRSPAGR